MEPEQKTNGALIGLIIIIIVLLIGGIYTWQSKLPEVLNKSGTVTPEDAAELNSLETELQTTETDTEVDANAIY